MTFGSVGGCSACWPVVCRCCCSPAGCGRGCQRGAALTAIAVLVVYPYAFFLHGAVYSDGLFLVTAIGAFLLLERRMYWLAGVVGALATAGRPVGLAVAVGLAVRVLEIRAEARALEMPQRRSAGSANRGRADAGAHTVPEARTATGCAGVAERGPGHRLAAGGGVVLTGGARRMVRVSVAAFR